MADQDLEKWKPRGMISLWRYEGSPKSYRGYHLAADLDACSDLLGLVDLFRKAQFPARKKIALVDPTSEVLAVPNCSQKCLPAKSLEFHFSPYFSEEHWLISEGDCEVMIEMGSAGLNALERGVSDMTQAVGDWSTGDGTESLWFWWHPGKSTS